MFSLKLLLLKFKAKIPSMFKITTLETPDFKKLKLNPIKSITEIRLSFPKNTNFLSIKTKQIMFMSNIYKILNNIKLKNND